MTRKKTYSPLRVFINNRLVGQLEKEPSGAVSFQYAEEWLGWEYTFSISLSLPLQKTAYRGAPVIAVFDNLLPDNSNIRSRVAERTGAEGTDVYSLLTEIGRDCVGAMQFLPEDEDFDASGEIQGDALSDADIEKLLANLKGSPLGIDPKHEFRISVAGAQDKTALLYHEGKWIRPIGATPTTHIFKPQLGQIPTSTGVVDMTASVDNEHYCLKLLESFGLPVAQTQIATFGEKRVLVVERFDRQWMDDGRLLRLPQEDLCQSLGVPSSQKYQSDGGPDAKEIIKFLSGSDNPLQDQAAFLKSQILFWLIGATDGHAKNFSVFLRPGNSFQLTPFYDVLSVQPVFDRKQITKGKYKLAMSAGKNRHYRIDEIMGRHFIQTAKAANLGPTIINQVISEILGCVPGALDKARAMMPDDFAEEIYESIKAGVIARSRFLDREFLE